MGRRLASALVLAATGGALFAASADAQLFERRQDFFPFSLFGDRGPPPPSVFPGFRGIPPPPSEGAKAPPPRKAETPPTSTVLVIGDSLADWLAYGLEEALTDTPEIGVVRKIRPLSGLVRYEARNEAIEWPQAVKEILAGEQPGVIVVMLGLNDRQALRERINPKPQKQETAAPAQGQGETPAAPSGSEPAQQSSGEPAAQPAPPAAAAAPASEPARPAQMVNYEFHTDKWTEAYTKRVDEMIGALKAKGVPVLWVGLPALRTRTNSDITYLDEIYRARAARAGIVYVDVWDGFVDDQGRFAVQGPDFEGQIRRLRAGDGVHFTKAGAVKLAHYVEHDLRRVMLNRPVPVALPGTDEQGPPKALGGGTARAAVGTVVPLNAGAAETGDLLGAVGTPAPGGAAADPMAARVLGRGDAIPAPPAGRADNFSWPRAGATANISNEVEIVPAAPAPPPSAQPAAAAKVAPGKSVAKKPEKPETKPDAKKEAAPETPPLRSPRRSRAELDGAIRPPSPIGPAAPNVR